MAVLVLATALIVFAAIASKRARQKQLEESLLQQSAYFAQLSKAALPTEFAAIALAKGEKVLVTLPGVGLTEYESTGSTYNGMNAGVSFPLIGSLRGNVGGQGGNITKNPEQLMIVDSGTAIFTNQRVLFSGAKFVRDWDLTKIVALEPGPNGFNIRLAVSNHERTSGLQAPSPYVLGPGYLAGYAFTWNQEGEAAARKWLENISDQLEQAVNTAREKK